MIYFRYYHRGIVLQDACMTNPSVRVKTIFKIYIYIYIIYPYQEKGISKDEWTVFAL